MKLTYLYHSGFVIEGENYTLILDFFQDTEDGFVQQNLVNFPGKLYVLVSHWHPDHFNPEILTWKLLRPDIHYIFSKDILRKRLVHSTDADFLLKGEVWEDDTLRVHAFGSTDVGISFLIDVNNLRIFHTGDLNNWHWSEESTPEEIAICERHFLKEVNLLKKTVSYLDLAIFPVDPRQGKDYMLGAQQFIDLIRVSVFSPMHFEDDFEKANAFKYYTEQKGVQFIDWHAKGDSIIL